MTGERREHLTVHGLERLPVHETRHALRTEGSHLPQLLLVDPVPEPALTREPAAAAEHDGARPASGHPPPVDGVALAERRRLLQRPRLADQPAQERPRPPR